MAKKAREASDMGAMVQRVLASLARRAVDGDMDVVTVMEHLRHTLDFWEDQAVANLRAEPWNYSWSDIGKAAGISKQAAQQRFGDVGELEACPVCGELVRSTPGYDGMKRHMRDHDG